MIANASEALRISEVSRLVSNKHARSYKRPHPPNGGLMLKRSARPQRRVKGRHAISCPSRGRWRVIPAAPPLGRNGGARVLLDTHYVTAHRSEEVKEMITPNAERQARWRAKRNKLARQASSVGGLITALAHQVKGK